MKIWIERLRSSKGEQGAAVSGLRVSCLVQTLLIGVCEC